MHHIRLTEPCSKHGRIKLRQKKPDSVRININYLLSALCLNGRASGKQNFNLLVVEDKFSFLSLPPRLIDERTETPAPPCFSADSDAVTASSKFMSDTIWILPLSSRAPLIVSFPILSRLSVATKLFIADSSLFASSMPLTISTNVVLTKSFKSILIRLCFFFKELSNWNE